MRREEEKGVSFVSGVLRAMVDLEKQEKVAVLEGSMEGERVNGNGEEEERERLLEGMSVLDFDMLCSSVALQSAHGSWGKLGGRTLGAGNDEEGEEQHVGGVLRMWEGEVLDCFDDRRIALESAW